MNAQLFREIVNKNNGEYASQHKPNILFKDFPDQNGAAVVCCADPRANPTEFLQVDRNGPAIIRTAGGRVREAIPSLQGLSTILSNGKRTLGVVAIIHHTNCGIGPENFDDQHIARRLKELGKGASEHEHELKGMDWGSFKDLEGSVREDMAILKANPFFSKDLEVLGYTYDVHTGKVKEVV